MSARFYYVSMLRRFFSAFALAGSVLLLFPFHVAAAFDFGVTGGWFYSEAGGGAGKGFTVLDSGLDQKGQVTRFYSEFNRLGGAAAMGYPASTVFTLPDGFIYQATQSALMQWRPEVAPNGGVALANVFDLLSQTGHDKDLLALGIPAPIGDDSSDGSYTNKVQTRISWLTQPLIRAKYLTDPNPEAIKQWDLDHSIQSYGLPTSPPQRFGPFVVQRFQRVAFQLWVDAVPGQPSPGTVVSIQAGDLAKRFAIVPVAAQQPQGAPGAQSTTSTVQAVPPLQPAIGLLTQYDQTHGTSYMQNLAEHRVSVILAPVSEAGALGYYRPDENTIRISNTVANEDAHDIADLISHESSHALDYWTGADMTSTQGCLDTEINAFKHQADVWRSFYPHLKPAPNDHLDQFLNAVTAAETNDSSGFIQDLTEVYQRQCAGN